MKNAFLFTKTYLPTIVLVILVFLLSGNSERGGNISYQVPENRRWTGTITLEQRSSGITGTSERHVTVTFNNALPTLHRDDATTSTDFTDDKGTGSETFHGEAIIEGKKIGITDSQGSGQTELHIVDIDGESYYIHAIGPWCTGTAVDLISGTTTTVEPYTTDITITEPLKTRTDILSGAKTETMDMGGGVGTVTTTITWHLVKSTVAAVELIVTPEDYDRWLPKPGRNDLEVGSVMNISLKLQARGGGPTTRKAKAFKLRLSNTSREPGVTINFPIAPWDDPLPDLRFELVPNGAVADEFQTLAISYPGGSQTATAKLGSYDGGGWTVLTAEAILTDDTRIQGKLLVSNGEIDIRIPKRDPNSKIGTAWLTSNGNPNELDDKETSRGNSNKGDGLTAYEEYRGVISEGGFKRLDPKKKELGIKIKRSDLALFGQAFQWFENASDLKIIRFYENEIARNRRLNLNALSAHDYDQFALRVETRNLPDGVVGSCYRGPGLPATVDPVIFDWNQIQSSYGILASNARPDALRFTLSEMGAWAITHELAHAVDVWHHGVDLREPDQIAEEYNRALYRIFDRHGNQVTRRPYPLQNIGGSRGTVESGDISCALSYNIYYSWGYTVGADGAKIFNQVPLLPVGKIFCKSQAGTDINATILYFGDAAKGNCLSQIKLR